MAKRVAAAGPVEGPWALPDGWRWVRLGDVAELLRGVTYAKPQIRSENDHCAMALLRGNNIQAGSLDFDDLTYVDEACVKPDQFIRANDIVLTMSSGSIGLIGKSGWVARDLGRTTFGAFCGVIRSSNISAKMLYYFLQTDHYRSLIRELAKGTNINNLKRDHLIEMAMPVPPADTQASIVARIDELFAEIDDGEAALARARDDLATWRKALLKAAVTGELTADWRAANPAAETDADHLARILAQRRASWEAEPSNRGKRYKEPRPMAIDDGRDLPDGWAWASVDQIGEVVTGNTPPASDLAAYDGDVPFFTPGDLDAGFALDATKRTLGPSGLAKSRPVPPRSVLVTCIGATIGKVGFNARAGATNQQINTIIPFVDDLAECIFHYFDGPGRHLVIDGASSTTMPIINKGDFSRLPVPIPPVEEAREIIRVIAARYADANAAREDMNEARLAAVALRQSVLAAAFRGELA